jgi:hypothetical protein
MRKIILTTLAVVGLVCFSQAQTTSANIVGYAKVTATGGELSLVALNFTPSSTAVSDLIGDQLPSGSTLHIWDKSSQSYTTYNKSGRGGWGTAANVVVGPSTGFWVQAVSAVSWDETRPFTF